MPHIMMYPRPRKPDIHHFAVTVRSPEGVSTFHLPAESANDARREAIRLYANEHDSPVTAWAEVH